MADKGENITTKFSIDVSQFKSGLAEANKQIKLANAEFKAASAGMDDWQSSTEGITAKLKQLDSVLAAEKSKLATYTAQLEAQEKAYAENGKRADELRARLQELADKGISKTSSEYKQYEKALADVEKEQQSNRNAADNLKVTILNQQAAVNKTEKEIRNYEKALDAADKNEEEVAKDAKTTSTSLATVDKESKNASKGMEAFGNAAKAAGAVAAAAITAAAGAIAAVGKKLAEFTQQGAAYADNILTLSTTTGISTEKLQEYSYAAELVDVSVETIAGSMTKLEKGMAGAAKGTGATAEAYKKLGVQVTNADGSLRDHEEVYWDTIKALSQVENETERDSLAMQILGKSAKDLNPIIQDGGEALQAYSKQAQNAGYVLSDDALAAFGEFDDQMQRLKGGTTAAKNALGTILLPMLTELAGEGTDLLGQFTQGIIDADGDIEKMGDVIADIIPQVVDTVVRQFPVLFDLVTKAAMALVTALVDNAPLILDAVLGLLPQLLATLSGMAPKLVDAATTIILALAQAGIDLLPQFLQLGIDLIIQLLRGIGEAAPQLMAMLPGLIQTVVQTLLDNFDQILQTGIDLILSLARGVLDALPDLIRTVAELAPAIIDKILSSIPLIIQCGIDLLSSLVEALPQILDGICSALPGLVEGIISGLMDNLPMIISAGIDLFMALVENTPRIILEICRRIPEIIGGIVQGVIRAAPKMAEGAKKLWGVLTEKFQNIGKWFGDKFGEAWNAIKNKFAQWGQFWAGLWDKVKNKFRDIGASIGSAISDTVKKGINGVLWTIESVLNKGVDLINGAIGLINKIPGVNIGYLNRLNLPRLAQGGVLRKGQVGLLEGSGAEAVVPLERNRNWIRAVATDLRRELKAGTTVTNSTSTTNNFTQIINAPQAPSRIEIYRQTRNLLAFAGG